MNDLLQSTFNSIDKVQRPTIFKACLPWLVCLSSALFFFYEFIQMNMFNAISSQLMSAFSLNATQLGYLSANYFYANLIFLLPAGLILDRFSTRKIILIALFICIVGTFLFAISTNLYLAAVCRFLTGIGSAFCFISCIRLASRWFPSQRMALISGIIVTMAMFGGTVAQAPLTHLVETLGWRQALIIDAAVGAFIFGIIFKIVQDFPEEGEFHRQRQQQDVRQMGFWHSMSRSYFNTQNWLCGIYTSLMNLPISLLGALWGILYLKQVHHYSANEASIITSFLFMGTIVGAPIAGMLSDRFGRRRIPMSIAAIVALLLMMVILNEPLHSVLTLAGLFFALGFITAAQVISYPTVAESNPQSLTATSVSVVSFSAISGYALSQPLFGHLMDWHWHPLIVDHVRIYTPSDFHRALWILPVGFVVAFIATLFIKETYCRPHE